ncbi:SA1788 family PVL leukocidin-associated protein, partial [Staphylococcus aureus]|uniref:SA1788 family PVL leukocidin-associated protein n=1 Tax=Staphylococcus aureus TaxID=1280 RepID=UPI00102350EB
FQDRLIEGWTLDEALKYKHHHVMYHGNVCRKSKMKDVTYYAVAEDLVRNNIESRSVQRYLFEGDFLGDILPLDCRFYVEYNHNAVNKLLYEDYQRFNRRKEKEAERERIAKPWLHEVPQEHGRSKYCQYLMDTSIFPKAVR